MLLAVCLMAKAQNESLVREQDDMPSVVERILKSLDTTGTAISRMPKINSHINLEFYTSANAYLEAGKYAGADFRVERVRLEMVGNISKHLKYHFRQSFNKNSTPQGQDRIAGSIEYANITWLPNEKFDLSAGKLFVAHGGYEYYVNALRIREFSEFNNNLPCYQAGIMGTIHFSPSQELILQVVNGRSGNVDSVFPYGLPQGVSDSKFPYLALMNWNGSFVDGALQFRYAAAVGEAAQGHNYCTLTAANVWEKGPVVAYLDVMYTRGQLDSQGRLASFVTPGQTGRDTQYLTLIANVDYRVHPKWNIYVKGVYERSGFYKDTGSFAAGNYLTNWNAQACVEWFPFSEDKGFRTFIHFLYKGNIASPLAKSFNLGAPVDTQRISLGLIYIIPVI